MTRFEKLDITPKSAQKIKPVLERWMSEAEERYKNGMQNLTEFIGGEPSKKRKRRTSFTPQALEVLNENFERNTHPSGGYIECWWVAGGSSLCRFATDSTMMMMMVGGWVDSVLVGRALCRIKLLPVTRFGGHMDVNC